MPDQPTDEAPGSAPVTPPTPAAAPEQVAARHLEAGHHHGHAQLPHLRILEEIKRRNVGRVAILYVVVSYVVLEVFEMFFHLLEMPPWTGRAAVLLAAIGFPVALLIAWTYEFTPEGLKPTDEVPLKKSIAAQTGRRLDRAIIVVLAIALLYFVSDKFWLSRSVTAAGVTAAQPLTGAAASDKSIAVLPFLDMSEKHDQEYFSDGLAEEVLDRLAQIPNLRVIARTSSFSFRSKADDIPTIAKQLNVTHILEGSVRKSGTHIRVTAQLIRASSGDHLWSQTFDSELSDIFKVQDRIASAVTEALRIQITAPAVVARTTTNPEAQSLLMEANYFSERINEQNLIHSAQLARSAIDLDPGYSDAWARLSVIYATLAQSHPTQGYREKAKDAATHAIQADPNNEFGHAAMVYVLESFGDVEGMGREIEFLTRGSRTDALFSNARAHYELFTGNWSAAIGIYEKALANDPVNPVLLGNLAASYMGAQRFNEAEKTLRRLMSVAPDYEDLHGELALVLLWKGDVTQALAEAQLEEDIDAQALALVQIYRAQGRIKQSDAALLDIEHRLGAKDPIAVAEAFTLAGQKERAFEWLNRAFSMNYTALQAVRADPYLLALHEDPRYQEFLHRLDTQAERAL